MIDISKMDKSEVLANLYNSARPQGLGFLHHTPEKMTTDQARKILDNGDLCFDYLNGRVLKVDLSGSEFDPRLYDRDNGQGSAMAAIKHLVAGK